MFNHDLQVKKLHDVRLIPCGNIKDIEVIYVVYRITVGSVTWFHHVVLLVDDMQSLIRGNQRIQNKLCLDFDSEAIITPVFIRSMWRSNVDVAAEVAKTGVDAEMLDFRKSCTDRDYIVFGSVGQHQITLITVKAGNAIEAALTAASSVEVQFYGTFFPLEVYSKLAAFEEIEAYYQKSMPDIRAMVQGSSQIITCH